MIMNEYIITMNEYIIIMNESIIIMNQYFIIMHDGIIDYITSPAPKMSRLDGTIS